MPALVDQATERILIMASPRRCFRAITDFERYSQWAGDIKGAEVLRRDRSGRAVDVEYHVKAMGRSTTYTLRYFYGTDPLRLAWKLVDGDALVRLDGDYEFLPVDGEHGAAQATEAVFNLAVELAVPLTGFVKRRAESRIVHTALDELKAYVEASDGRGD